MTSQDIVNVAVKTLDSKKARDILALEVRELTTLSDYFVIATGGSSTQVKALANEVEKKLKDEYDILPSHVEQGTTAAQWVLMDYNTVLIHIFNQDSRDFYNLERLWTDAKAYDIEDLLTAD